MSEAVLPTGGASVMQQRREPRDSLDFFPTPPWATRALCEIVLPRLACDLAGAYVWEPACGEGHMAQVLRDYCAWLHASDVHDYGKVGFAAVGSFIGEGLDVIPAPPNGADWIITNPPFNLAVEFAERALTEAREGVALLVRTSWLEGAERYERLFRKHRPLAVAQFCERVPMVKGRWDPQASTATSYAWVVWLRGSSVETRFMWIPPGQRQALTRPDDVRRFALPGDAS